MADRKQALITKLEKVDALAHASKLKRLFHAPLKYIFSAVFRLGIYSITKKGKQTKAITFFDKTMHINLPSGTDIYLTGGKSHASEIRLAKYLINQLNDQDSFIDVGAHYGYFSLLANCLVGQKGQVYSFEASPKTFKVLTSNTDLYQNISAQNIAVSDTNSTLSFFEFPNLYSEFNTLDISQFKDESWLKNNQPKEHKIKAILLDDFVDKNRVSPKMIKIDVEGAEFKVINGAKSVLKQYSPIVVIEYLSDNRSNSEHKKAASLLSNLGYQAHRINNKGHHEKLYDISDYFVKNNFESDNIVFIKSYN